MRDLLLAEAAAKAVARVRCDAAQAHDVERQPRRDQTDRVAKHFPVIISEADAAKLLRTATDFTK